LIPGKSVPEVKIFQIDKLAHVFIFAVLMVLSLHGTFKYTKINSWGVNLFMLTGVTSMVFGLTIEIIQIVVPGRNFSLLDVVANTLGVGLGGIAFKLWGRFFLKW